MIIINPTGAASCEGLGSPTLDPVRMGTVGTKLKIIPVEQKLLPR